MSVIVLPASDKLVNSPLLLAAPEICASDPVSVMPSTSLTLFTYCSSVICQMRPDANACAAMLQSFGCQLPSGPTPPPVPPVVPVTGPPGPVVPGPPVPVPEPLPTGSSPICPVHAPSTITI